jgi:hypothetical protein
MSWQYIVGPTLAAIGALGFCFMIAAFVLIARQGGWQQVIGRSVAERRWPLPRRLLLIGATLAFLFAIGITILCLIPGGRPWIKPTVYEQANSERSTIASPNVVAPRPAQGRSQPRDASSLNEQPSPEFDPRLIVAWPGIPEESHRRIDAGTDREATIYSATFTQVDPVTVFNVRVYELTERELEHYDPERRLASHFGGDEVVEQTRKRVALGRNKYLALEVTARDANLFIRRVNVLAGRSIISVEVNSLKQERLSDDDVIAFFDSFEIKD